MQIRQTEAVANTFYKYHQSCEATKAVTCFTSTPKVAKQRKRYQVATPEFYKATKDVAVMWMTSCCAIKGCEATKAVTLFTLARSLLNVSSRLGQCGNIALVMIIAVILYRIKNPFVKWSGLNYIYCQKVNSHTRLVPRDPYGIYHTSLTTWWRKLKTNCHRFMTGVPKTYRSVHW